jgi:proton glutamate symport protein
MQKKAKIPWNIFIAIILATFFGSWAGTERTIFGITFYSILDTLGSIFLNALTLLVVPLVSSSIITGIARIGNDQSFGRLGKKMFAFFLGTSLMAILIGLLFVNIFSPGSMQSAPQSLLGNQSIEVIKKSDAFSMSSFLIQIIPPNIVEIFSQGHMLGLILFSLLFGYTLSKIDSHPSSILQGFWQGIFQTMIQITHILLKFLPYGVFCLVGKVFATSGLQSLQSLVLFFITAITGFAVFMFIGLPILLKFVAKVSPIRHFKAMTPALITAFSTSSSSAALPVTIDCVEKRAGVSNRICGLVIPLGTTINMSGSALYSCIAALFVAQCYGMQLTFMTQLLTVAMSLVASVGIAGIPSGSLVSIIVILKVLGLPPEGIGLFIAVDRILDMCRTTVNVFSDSTCAVLVACSEGEKNVLASDPENA